ncbi:MAG TPA: serine hydrolase [Pirellulales bacterium]|jgi:CubicO group peptidase (beta-lactamase class C family)
MMRHVPEFLRSLCWVLVVAAAPAPATEYAPDVQQRITEVEQGLIPAVRVKGQTRPTTIADRLARDHVPAVSIAVINNNQLEWAKAYGSADAETGTAATTETLFQAASMSKPLTALAALRLVDEGLLALDEDVNKKLVSWHLPENEFTRAHVVDLRGLLSHTAGTTVHGFPGYTVGDPLPTVPQILDGLKPANSPPVRVNKVPGHGFRYSGGGTTIVQLLITDVTGRPFADVMHDKVLTPFGMTSSTYEQPLPVDRHTRAASAHNDKGTRIEGRWHVYPEQGAAALWTTPSELTRYMMAVQQAHGNPSDKLLSHELLNEMLTPQGGGPAGLGPFIVEKEGSRRFEHSGGNEGFRCNFIAFLDRGQGAVVMTNSDSGNRTVNEVMNSIAAAYDWPGFLPPEREVSALDPELLDRLVGDYALNVASLATISRRGDSLFLKLPRQEEIELHPASATEFFSELPEIQGTCELDASGQVARIVFQLGDREVSAKRVR